MLVLKPLTPDELASALPDKPSLAVLPFENLSDRSDDQYMADGFVDTLITELMSLQDLVVIAKNSSFSFRDQQVLNSAIAEQLGVRYLLAYWMRSKASRFGPSVTTGKPMSSSLCKTI